MHTVCVTSSSSLTTICVSGYPALVAQTVSINGMCATVAGSFQAISHAVARTVTWLTVVDRCRGCNTWLHTPEAQHRSFGPPYCLHCATTVATQCRNRHGRLPSPEEFFCGSVDGRRGCGRIVPRADAVKRDPDGRHRWRCRGCRARQWARANENRKRRWGR